MLRYLSFESNFKLRECCIRDLFGSQIPLTTGRIELRISCIRSSYLTHQAVRPNRLSGFGVPKFATLRKEQLIYVEILQLQAMFQTAIVLCSRFTWITNFSDHMRTEVRISCIRISQLTQQAVRRNSLGGFGVPEFTTLRQEQLIYVEILQLRYFYFTQKLFFLKNCCIFLSNDFAGLWFSPIN